LWGFLVYQLVVFRLIPELTQSQDPTGGNLFLTALPIALLLVFVLFAATTFCGLLMRRPFGRWMAIVLLLYVSLTTAWRVIMKAIDASIGFDNAAHIIGGLAFEIILVTSLFIVVYLMLTSRSVISFFNNSVQTDSETDKTENA
jgi:hypothetical protein